MCWGYEIAFTNTDKSLSYSPANSRALTAKTFDLVNSENIDDISPSVSSNLQTILKSNPLNDDAFLHLALLDYNKTGQWNREDALSIALERNPRNTNTLKASLQLGIINEDFFSVVDILDILMELKWDDANDFFPILDALYNDPQGQKAILDKINQNPSWKFRYVFFVVNSANENNILRILPIIDIIDQGEDQTKNVSIIKTRYLIKLVNLGYVENAYDLWKSWHGTDNTSPTSNGVINSQFQPPISLPPFNWVLLNNEYVTTSRSISDGLFASFNDTRPKKVMYQVIPVDGAFEGDFTSEISWNYRDRQGYFEWRIYCTRDRDLKFRFPLNDDNKGMDRQTFSVNLDQAKCDFINLELWGMPGQLSSRLSILVKSINIQTSSEQ